MGLLLSASGYATLDLRQGVRFLTLGSRSHRCGFLFSPTTHCSREGLTGQSVEVVLERGALVPTQVRSLAWPASSGMTGPDWRVLHSDGPRDADDNPIPYTARTPPTLCLTVSWRLGSPM